MEFDDTSARLKRLVQIGKTRGYILYDEIDQFLPLAQEAEAQLDIVLVELTANGIEILEEPGSAIDPTDQALHDLNKELDDSSATKIYLREVMTIPRLTQGNEIELAKRISHGGQDGENAMKQLVEANLYLVVAVAKRRAAPGYGLLELIQKGNVGLMQATEKYKHTREYRFSTYSMVDSAGTGAIRPRQLEGKLHGFGKSFQEVLQISFVRLPRSISSERLTTLLE